ncbi:hypothetical protein, partial [Azospirillum brasilense]|uniref:hypothetical protein n=1 Tax=Azospirillum brasilense TaxID=192 RepID=UPI00157B386E
ATHAITSAPGGTANLNVSVTATDDAGNVKTTADTTNATLEVAGPTVTDGTIPISGGSGPGAGRARPHRGRRLNAVKRGFTIKPGEDRTLAGLFLFAAIAAVSRETSHHGSR